MRIHTLSSRVTIISLLISPAGPVAGWQTPAPAPTTQAPKAAPAQTPAAAQTPQPPDGGWPRAYTTSTGAGVIVYQPQIADWPEQKHMTLYAAVSYQPKNAQKAAIGTVKVESDASVAVAERLVSFSEFKITEANFPTLPKEQLKEVVAEITAAVPRQERVIALDRVLAMVDTSQVKPQNMEGVKADPPPVFYSETPAVLVIFDGEPIWSPIEGNELRFAVNTNWDVFEHSPSKQYFLRINNGWLVSSSPEGPWKVAEKLPDSFQKLPDDGNWTEVKASLKNMNGKDAIRTVFVSTVPAELIQLTGAPKYEPVQGTNLLWVSNTESDAFRMGKEGAIFYLVAGRWFSAPRFAGPWTFATPTLPDDFKKIPLEHPRSRVLAAVPGTRQAIEGVLLAQVPQSATVNRKTVQAPPVNYQGDPKFEPIEKTTVARAVNTDKDVLKVGDDYYMCFEGVWFRSKSASGPWEVADSIPKEIYSIPMSSPAHNVTYVTVEDSDDDAVVFVAAAAYTGMMIAWGCAVWGSGWYYPPYYGGGFYPAYYGHYPTYGYGAHYNPWNGAYSRGGGVYGPYGGAGYGARYNPSTGRYSRGTAAYGPYGSRGAAQAWNPRTGVYSQTRQGSNVYGSWGSTQVQRGNQWASTSRVTNRATGATTRATQTSSGAAAVTRTGPGGGATVGRTAGGDIYAGHDGNAYRNQGGSWQRYDNGNWTNTDPPQRSQGADGTAEQRAQGATGATGSDARARADQAGRSDGTTQQLNQDRAARNDGAQRTRDASAQRSAPRPSGSYQPRSGGGARGGARGGGGRRR